MGVNVGQSLERNLGVTKPAAPKEPIELTVSTLIKGSRSLTKLRLAKYQLKFRAITDIQLPDYAGSMLRGAFGHALMQLSNLNKQEINKKTHAYRYSPYAAVFEPVFNPKVGLLASMSDVPVPYVIKAPTGGAKRYKAGETFTFEFVLHGQALAYLSTVVLAWRRALLKGLGKDKAQKAELIEVLHCDPSKKQTIYSEARPILAVHHAFLEAPEFNEPQTITLDFKTPLRLQHQGKVVSAKHITPALLLRNLIRRVSIYLQLENPEAALDLDVDYLNNLADKVTGKANMQDKSWTRHSNRQRSRMNLNGLVGRIKLEQAPPELLPFIWFGQYTHVGKNTSFGLGGYKVVLGCVE